MGNSLEQQGYSFVDESPLLRMNYYRLKQMDFDGAYEYSQIVAIDMKRKDETASLLSNLVQDQLMVNVSNPANLRIMDAMGRMVQEHTITGTESINVAHLVAGSYFLLVTVEGRTEVLRFVKQ